MTQNQEKLILKILKKFHKNFNMPNKANDIEICNNKISIIINNQIFAWRILDSEYIKNHLSKINYPMKNPFFSTDIYYSPFEADRPSAAPKYWKKKYTGIDFPKFIPIALISLTITGEFPSVEEFIYLYINTYTENVPINEIQNNRKLLFSDKNANDRTTVGKPLNFFKNKEIYNSVRRFKKEYLYLIKNLPVNEFTTEQLCNRMFKVYGSVVRDPYNMLRFNYLGTDTYYSLFNDITLGIDGFIQNYPYYGYSKTSISNHFRQVKVSQRHPEIQTQIGISIKKSNEKQDGVYLMSDEKIKNLITTINTKPLTSSYSIDC